MIIITVARKPLEGTVARNALKHGTGGINIDAVRTGGPSPSVDRRMHAAPGVSVGSTGWTTPAGRSRITPKSRVKCLDGGPRT